MRVDPKNGSLLYDEKIFEDDEGTRGSLTKKKEEVDLGVRRLEKANSSSLTYTSSDTQEQIEDNSTSSYNSSNVSNGNSTEEKKISYDDTFDCNDGNTICIHAPPIPRPGYWTSLEST